MGKVALFNRGIPTEPDVTKLTQTFGVPVEGEPITYAAVAEAIGVPAKSSRWLTVTAAWRKGLRAMHGLILLARDGQFVVRDPSSRIGYSKAKTKAHITGLTNAHDIAEQTDSERLSERERGDRDKVLRITSVSLAKAMEEAKRKAPPMLRAVSERQEASGA